MTTERSLAKVPRQERVFYPEEHADPVEALSAEIRRLRLGERVRLPNDTVVLSRTVKVGPHEQRRFSVVPSLENSSAVERHRIVALGHDNCKTAAQAAAKALKGE